MSGATAVAASTCGCQGGIGQSKAQATTCTTDDDSQPSSAG